MGKNIQYSKVLIVGLLLIGLPIGAIAQTADVATTLTLTTPTTVNPGNAVAYTVSVANNGPNPAQNVVPQVQLPAGLASSIFTLPAGASYTNATGVVTLPTSASLAANTTLSYSFSFTAPYYSATLLAVASSTASTTDPVPTNNDGSATAARATVTDVVLGNNCTGTGYGPASPVSGGLYAEYYAGYFADNLSFFNSTGPSLSRYDATVNFPANNSWGDLRPAGSGTAAVDNPQTYSARYRGSISIATSGPYTFSLSSDDASYLWLDGAALATTPTVASATVNNGGAHPATTVSATVTLTAGPHNVLIFYGQQGGLNNFIFSYAAGTSNPQPTVPVPNNVLCATQVPLPAADVATTLTLTTPTTVNPGSAVAYTVSVANNGPNPAQNVVPQVQLPAGLASSIFTLPAGASYTNATGVVTLPTSASLAANTTLSYSFSFTAPYYSATLLAVASSTASTTDPVPTNNDGSATAARATVTDVVLGNNCTGTGYGPASPVSGGLYAEYYAGYFADNLSFFNSTGPSLSRYDATVNFPANNSWGDLRPAGSGTAAVDNPQTYSARYRGSISIATSGPYTFSLSSDDASYLWLDGAALATTPTVASATVNNGGAHPATTVSATVTLTAGPHNVLIFYGQQGGLNNFIFSYAAGTSNPQPTVPVPNNVLCATQVPLPAADVATTLTLTTPTTVNPGSAVAYTVSVANNGPNPAQNVVPQVQLPAGLASSIFTLPAGASYTNATGVVTLPTSASLAANTTLSYSFSFTAPYYSATLLAVASSTASTTDPVPTNNDGSATAARATVTVALPVNGCTGTSYSSGSPTSGLYAEYYAGYFADNLSFFNSTASSLTRTDATVNFPANNSWGDLRPAGSGTAAVDNPQTYSARYRGSISIATSGPYTFSLSSDDASYLWLDGAALATTPTVASATINNGGLHGATTVSATVTLTAGRHDVLIFYGQNAGDNNFIFSYAAGTSNPQPTVPVPNNVLCNSRARPLPVQLTAFEAKVVGSAAQLTWTTASEQNSAYFAVEFSSNGHTFTELGQVLAQGSKASVTDYTYRDTAFGAQPAGQPVYYRLRQVDQDGTVAYSPMRSLVPGAVPGKVAPSISCYPVPAAEDVTVDLQMLPAQNFELTLVDLAGRITRRWNLAGGQLQHLSLSGLPVGLYQLLVTGTLTEGKIFRQNLRLPKE